MIGIIFYIINAGYALKTGGFLYGLINMILPFAIILDISKALLGQ